MNIKGDCGEGSERKELSCGERFQLLSKHVNNGAQSAGRNIDVKEYCIGDSGGNEHHIMGKKGNPCYKVEKNFLNCILVFCGR